MFLLRACITSTPFQLSDNNCILYMKCVQKVVHGTVRDSVQKWTASPASLMGVLAPASSTGAWRSLRGASGATSATTTASPPTQHRWPAGRLATMEELPSASHSRMQTLSARYGELLSEPDTGPWSSLCLHAHTSPCITYSASQGRNRRLVELVCRAITSRCMRATLVIHVPEVHTRICCMFEVGYSVRHAPVQSRNADGMAACELHAQDVSTCVHYKMQMLYKTPESRSSHQVCREYIMSVRDEVFILRSVHGVSPSGHEVGIWIFMAVLQCTRCWTQSCGAPDAAFWVQPRVLVVQPRGLRFAPHS